MIIRLDAQYFSKKYLSEIRPFKPKTEDTEASRSELLV